MFASFKIRYDVKGKQYLKTGGKYDAADIGLRYCALQATRARNTIRLHTVIDADGKALEHALAPLDAINDHNPKYLLTMDLGPLVSHNRIKQINVWTGF